MSMTRAMCAAVVGLALTVGFGASAVQAQPSAPGKPVATEAAGAAVGEITFAQGAVSAQRPGEPARFLI